jgi:peroxiredoxin family protein
MTAGALGILLIAGGHERAHSALMLATTAAALGRDVVLFATNEGCRLLMQPSPLLDDPREALLAARGVATIAVLKAAATELGIRCIACEAGLRAAALDAALLPPAVEVAGLATFLAATAGGQMIAV